jgi:hypothetical protein
MGTGVLNTTVSGPRTVRAYGAHCAVGATCDLAVLLLNLCKSAVRVDLVVGSGLHQAARTEWHFTAGAGGLGGTGIELGGTELQWTPGQPLPPMPGVVETTTMPVQVAPQSIVFVRLPDAAPAELC